MKLGNLPGKEISAINNKGQVLIKSIVEQENGKTIRRPVIWHNGKITKLNGVEGNAGIPSEESYGLDMNNKGEVVGQSRAYLIFKNRIYEQLHAVKWTNGQVVDLHNKVPKSTSSNAIALNDAGDMLVKSSADYGYDLYCLVEDKIMMKGGNGSLIKINNGGYAYCEFGVVRNGNHIIAPQDLNAKIQMDFVQSG